MSDPFSGVSNNALRWPCSAVATWIFVVRPPGVPLNIGIADVIRLVHIDEPADSDILVLGTKEPIPSPQVFLTN